MFKYSLARETATVIGLAGIYAMSQTHDEHKVLRFSTSITRKFCYVE